MLATSGTTGAEGESIGNSWKFSHLAEAFSTQWSDASLAARDAKARKSEAVVAVVGNFDLSGLSEAASRIENAISWNGTDPQIVEYEDDDDDYYEEDVDWYTGDCDDELDETAYTVMVIWKTLMRLHLKRMHRQVAVFKKHVGFWLASRVPEGIFLLLLVLFDGLAQPSTDRKLVKSRDKGKKGKRKGDSSAQKGGKPTSLGSPGILPKSQTSRVESSPPMSKKRPTEAGATRGGPHHAPRLRPDQCMLCRQVGHRASECPNKGIATAFSSGKRAFGTYALGCAVSDSPCYGATVEEIEQDQDEEDIEDFVAFSMKSLKGIAILDGGATKTVSGFISVQPVADQYEGTTIETTEIGFTFAAGETEAASTRICIPHAEFPQGISVNVVSNESTPFLIGLDVLREYVLVIDYHHNRVCSHILKRCLLCATLPTGHLALEMMPSNSE